MHPGKDILTYLPAKIVLALAGIMAVPIITRLFDPGIYGKYILTMTLVRVMGLSASWISASIVRFYPEHEVKNGIPELTVTIRSISLIWLAFISMMYVLSLIFLRGHVEADMYRLLWLGLPLFILSATYDTLLEFLRARRLITKYSGYVMWRATVGLVIGLFIAMTFFAKVDALICGTIACLLLAIPKMWREAYPSIGKSGFGFSRSLAWEITTYGIPGVVSELSSWVMMLSDRYLINHYRNASEVGVYASSFCVAEYTLSIIASLIGLTSGGMVFHLWEKEGEAKAKAFMSTMCRYFLVVSIPAAVGLSLLAEPLISVVMSPKYHEGYRIVPLIVSGAFFLGLQQRYHAGINIIKKNYLLMISLISCAVLNVVLNLIFIPRWGYLAAAATMTVSNIALYAMVCFLSRRYIIWTFPTHTMLRVVASSAVMAIFILGLRIVETGNPMIDLAILIPTGVVIYFLSLYMLGEYDTAACKRILASLRLGQFAAYLTRKTA